jgi:hypothetical protein
MRKRANRVNLRSHIYQTIFALGLIAYGFYFPSFCGDCAEHPILGILVAAGLVALGVFWIVWIVRQSKKGDQLGQQLRPYGDPQEFVGQIEADFPGQSFTKNRVYLSKRWLCFSRRTFLIVRPIDSLIWAYLETVQHRWNYILKLGKTHQLVLWDRTGRGAALELKKEQVEEALVSLQRLAPWMLFGYTDTLKETWNNDRDDLIALVDQRRNEIV